MPAPPPTLAAALRLPTQYESLLDNSATPPPPTAPQLQTLHRLSLNLHNPAAPCTRYPELREGRFVAHWGPEAPSFNSTADVFSASSDRVPSHQLTGMSARLALKCLLSKFSSSFCSSDDPCPLVEFLKTFATKWPLKFVYIK